MFCCLSTSRAIILPKLTVHIILFSQQSARVSQCLTVVLVRDLHVEMIAQEGEGVSIPKHWQECKILASLELLVHRQIFAQM